MENQIYIPNGITLLTITINLHFVFPIKAEDHLTQRGFRTP